MNFGGSYVAMITPFRDGKVDEASIEKVVEFQVENGTSGLLPCGTTGESATLSHDEHHTVIDLALKYSNGRLPVVAGTGSNSTAEAIELTKHAADAGVSGALLICPYYNKPTQDGLLKHFLAIAESVDIPLFIYNIPSRTGVNMLPKTIVKAAEHPNIVGIKEATGDIGQITEMMALVDQNETVSKKGFNMFSGDDALTYAVMAMGGVGVITASANVVPRQMASIVSEFQNGNFEESRKQQFDLLELIDTFFIETNPSPVKTAASMMGLCEPEFRLPMCEMKKENVEIVRKVLKKNNVIS